MYDYIFMRILKAEDMDTLDAIDCALDASNYDLSKTKIVQLHLICGMQKQIFLLRERAELAEALVEKSGELRDSCEDLMNYIGSKMGLVKVTVAPIEKEEE